MCVQLSVWLIIVLIWSGQSVINTEYASKGRSRNMCFRSSDMPHQIFPKKLFSFLLIIHISVPSFLQQVLNWLVWKSGSLIFVFYKIVTFVWMYVCGNTCTTCAPVLCGGGTFGSWFLPSTFLRQDVSYFCCCTLYYRLRSTNCQAVLLCAPPIST